MVRSFAAVASLLLVCFACATQPDLRRPAPEPATAFLDVAVVPMERDGIVEHQTVVIRGDRIAQIGNVAEVVVPPDALRIDGHGKFLMPGLADMHVHLRTTNELPLYVANGVTTVFNLDGAPQHLAWRAKTSSGEVFGPTIVTCGPKFDRARTPQESVAEVAAQAAAGYDAVKIYSGVSKAEYPYLLRAAREHGLFIVGHVPKEVGIEGALAAGQAIEHAEEYVYRYFNKTLDIDQLVFDEGRIPAAVALTRDAGIWFTPTLVTYDQIMQQAADLGAFLQRPEMRYIGPALREKLGPENNLYKRAFSQAQVPKVRQNLAFQKKLVAAMHAAGVPMLAGTDAMGIGTTGGFSLHEELRNFVECGFTPYEALRTATSNASAFFNRPHEFGVVRAGARADLLLVDANPLADVANAARRSGVMLRGRWYDEASLHARLEALPQAYAHELQFVRDELRTDPAAALRYLDENDTGGLASYVLYQIVLQDGTGALRGVIASIRSSRPDSLIVAERTINTLGYSLLRSGHRAAAISVLALNAETYPKSANTWDSLAEAYDADGQHARAADNYRKALEVNPNYPNAEFAQKYIANNAK